MAVLPRYKVTFTVPTTQEQFCFEGDAATPAAVEATARTHFGARLQATGAPAVVVTVTTLRP